MTRAETTTETAAPPLAARGFFDALSALAPLRIISVCGPSVFEAICDFAGFGVADGWLNAITPEYHWHLDLGSFHHLRSRDEVHQRSGRRVLFFELRETAASEPFLLVYLHRGKGEELSNRRESGFRALHERFAEGRSLAAGAEVRR
jgi:hypothetical protein